MSPRNKILKISDASDANKTKDYIIVALASTVFLLTAIIAYTKGGADKIEIEPAVSAKYEQKQEQEQVQQQHEMIVNEVIAEEQVKRLRYWSVVLYVWHDMGHARSMDRVFERLQYKFVNASHGDEWDFLWSLEHPYALDEEDQVLFVNITKITLRKEQKINHYPSIATLVVKSLMSDVNAGSRYILPSFIMPDDLERLNEFVQNNPDAKLVEKNIHNRGVKIITRDEVDEEESETFYQQFMDDHFLIDGHAFDLGIFVLITSFDPLRIYRYNADVLFRFCSKPYHPFDPNDFDRYVVKSGCHNAYDMPTFESPYYRYGFSFTKIFEQLITEKGHDVEKLWEKIDEAIVEVVMNTEVEVIKGLKRRNVANHHFFELVRFDFIIDNKMNPYVMEVNMSPNLTPAAERYEENSNLYEPLIYNAIQMVGGGSYYEFMARFNKSDIVVANRRNIGVGMENCLKHKCNINCYHKECRICLPCVDEKNRYQMREAFREHTHENNYRRLFPTIVHYYDEELIDSMTENNQISIEWFKAQCEYDKTWC